ncbi:ABC transporter permease [Roseibium suaedae]|uniref:Capsular polysaccharide transport system permease protein n=1 Tax=Roseibium suaedae TaxID=735517 RepID=A0A1M7P6Q7_9HYPH|nr:ABC transporter permease [Roseibium suaedae]SHN12305.1 capsular polysaccharide transport system permease protein [Roseibium suaedae]
MTVVDGQQRRYRTSITFKDALLQKRNVMHAVILRDIRSRYFNHGLGFLLVPMMPVFHMGFLLTVYSVMGRQSAFGDDLRVFFATGLIPAMMFMYVSRFMSISLLANKSMMAFPVVRLLDIVLARAALEMAGMILSIGVMFVILLSTGSDPYPFDTAQALDVMLTVCVLAIGMGIIASIIASIAPFFTTVYGLTMALTYVTSGAPIYLHAFPEQVISIVSWNPIFHAVEWMRSAYYLGYPTQWLSKGYLLGWALGSVSCGLIFERLLRTTILKR